MNGTFLCPVEELIHLFRQMESCEAKWMIHFLKDPSSAKVSEMVTGAAYHPGYLR
jgi:hypothetical protein